MMMGKAQEEQEDYVHFDKRLFMMDSPVCGPENLSRDDNIH